MNFTSAFSPLSDKREPSLLVPPSLTYYVASETLSLKIALDFFLKDVTQFCI